MIEILALRHAKTEHPASGFPDFERRLRPEGKDDARSIGHWMVENSLIPDVVVCSASLRARETADIATAEFGLAPLRFDLEELYGANATDYLSIMAEHGGSAKRVLIVGHNPAVSQFVSQLAGRALNMSPGTLAVLEAEATRFGDFTPETTLRLRKVVNPPGKTPDEY